MMDDVQKNTIVFFAVSTASVFVCCVIFHLTRRSDFVRFYISMCKTSRIEDDQRSIMHQVTNVEEVSLVREIGKLLLFSIISVARC